MGTGTVGARLLSIRGYETRLDFAKRYGLHINTLARYERGERNPDAEFLTALVRAGYNANWILTGVGSVKGVESRGEQAARQDPSGVDWELMQQVMETMEAVAADIGRKIMPKAKARLTRALYQYYAGKTSGNSGSVARDRDGMADIVKIALETGET